MAAILGGRIDKVPVRPTKPLPSQEWLREHITYNPETGEATWAKSSVRYPKRFPKGRRVGYAFSPDKYTVTRLPGHPGSYRLNRLIWRYMTGEDPGEYIIDHRNRNKSDNSWNNLRKVDFSENSTNAPPEYTDSNRILNIFLCRGKWVVKVSRKCQSVISGGYNSIEEAASVKEVIISEYKAGLWDTPGSFTHGLRRYKRASFPYKE